MPVFAYQQSKCLTRREDTPKEWEIEYIVMEKWDTETGMERLNREGEYWEGQLMLRAIWGFIWGLSRNFLKYKHIWKKSKCNHQTVGETKPQVDLSCHQVKPPLSGIGHSKLSGWPKRPMETPKQLRRLPKLFVVLHKLIAKTYCWRQDLHNSTKMKKLSWSLTRTFTHTD